MRITINPYMFSRSIDWNPKDISGLLHYSNAENFGLNDGDYIYTWKDLSGNNNDGVFITGSTELIYREGYRTFVESGFTSGKPYTGFWPNSHIGCRISLGSVLTSSTAGTAFIVVNVTTQGNLAPIPGQSYHLGLWEGTLFPNTNYKISETFGSTTAHETTSPVSNLGYFWRTYIVTSKASEYKMYLDGTLIYSSGTNTVSFPSDFVVGQNTSGSLYPLPTGVNTYPYFWGGLRAFGLYNKALSTSEVSTLHNYLRRYCII